jgi:hypothetical protein
MVRVRIGTLHTRKPVLSFYGLGIVVFEFGSKVGSRERLVVLTPYFRSDKRRMVFVTKRKNVPSPLLVTNDVVDTRLQVGVMRWLCHTY